jgi:hypothetical protein
MSFFQSDTVYRYFLARHPGLWREVGALDDPGFLREPCAARRVLGLRPVNPLRNPRRGCNPRKVQL